MSVLRVVLVVGNALLFAWVAYLTSTNPPSHGWEYIILFGALGVWGLNLVYLLAHRQKVEHQPKPKSRIFRLIGLWLDAKEGELRQRADRSRQGK